jgi:5'-phosphate synthase pdxT subunit
LRIGALALQGASAAHLKVLVGLQCDTVAVKLPRDLEGLDGLIVPGGESTTIGKLMARTGLDEAIRAFGAAGNAIFGTCAGMILLANRIEDSDQPHLGLMDMTVRRNAFGRQVESFEADIPIPILGDDPCRAVFIRAPWVSEVGPGVEVLATYQDRVVLARQNRLLACAFHPELTDDSRIHRLFLGMAADSRT